MRILPWLSGKVEHRTCNIDPHKLFQKLQLATMTPEAISVTGTEIHRLYILKKLPEDQC